MPLADAGYVGQVEPAGFEKFSESDQSDGVGEPGGSDDTGESDDPEESDDSDGESDPDNPERAGSGLRWTISAGGAAIYLRGYFPLLTSIPSPSRSPLLELTAELRETIFDMVLRFPLLVFHNDYSRRSFHALDYPGHDRDDLTYWSDWNALETQSASGNIGKLSHALALLQVNKQCYHEALPLFYQVNTIFLPNGNSMATLKINT